MYLMHKVTHCNNVRAENVNDRHHSPDYTSMQHRHDFKSVLLYGRIRYKSVETIINYVMENIKKFISSLSVQISVYLLCTNYLSEQ